MALLEVPTPKDLGLHPKRTHRDAEREEATKRRNFLAVSGLGMLTVTDPPSRVGAGDVDQLRRRFGRLVGIDSYLGGGDTFRTYYSELERTERILGRSNCALSVRRALTELAAEQAQQSGWAAFDAGFTDIAVTLYTYSHRAAQEADSPELVANACIHIAYATGSTDALRAADSACETIGVEARPRAKALLESRRAWALASLGDREGAARALDAARTALLADDGTDAAWCAWVDHAELDIMTGRVWSVLHEPEKAIAPLRAALSSYPDQWARDKALYLTWLADAYIDAGDPTTALTMAETASGLAEKVASVRPSARVWEVAQRCVSRGAVGAADLVRRLAIGSSASDGRL